MAIDSIKSRISHRVALGMSGGIDSTISVLRLKKQGHIVVGFTFIFAPNFNKNSHIPEYAKEAARLAKKLEIEHHIIDTSSNFSETIIAPFLRDYIAGVTPFPCALCNKKMKWHALYEQMQKHGCTKMATGHYTKIVKVDGSFCIAEHEDAIKDQSYFLWGIPNAFLKDILFPLQDISKEEVRQSAKKYGLPELSEKQESFGVCFAADGNYQNYIKKHVPNFYKKVRPGNFITEAGKVVGRHQGLIYYTIGQRKDLNLYTHEPLYVKQIKASTNQIVVSPKKGLAQKTIFLKDFVVHHPGVFQIPHLQIKTKYRGDVSSGTVRREDDYLVINLNKEAHALAPGQVAVVYHDGVVLAGGFISHAG